MLVSRGVCNDTLELVERQFVEAFANGYATKEHYDNLADMRNVLMIGAAHKSDIETLAAARGMLIVMQNIRANFDSTGQMSAEGDELEMMRQFCDVYRDFWMRQQVALYESACDALNVEAIV